MYVRMCMCVCDSVCVSIQIKIKYEEYLSDPILDIHIRRKQVVSMENDMRFYLLHPNLLS